MPKLAAYCLVAFGLCASATSAFVGLAQLLHRRLHSTQRHGIAEWRDTMFDYPEPSVGELPTKEICVLPFAYTDVLLQGETKELRLYEERFTLLFDDCMENHGGLVAMGFFVENDGLVQTVPLAEVEAYNRMGGDFGIFLTIRVVGRAKVGAIVQGGPYIKVTCTEIVDEISPNHELLNQLGDRLEDSVEQATDWEDVHRIRSTGESAAKTSATRDDESEDDDDDDDNQKNGRSGRYKAAYAKALSSDSQGYQTSFSSESDRTMQELTAISWAAFSTEQELQASDLVFKIKALDCCSLEERLGLGIGLLDRKTKLARSKVEKLTATPGLNQTDASED